MKIDLNCPVEVWRVDAPKTGYPSCELTLFNLSGQQVVSVEATLVLRNASGAELSRINHRAHGLTGAPKRTFSMTIPIEEPITIIGYDVIVEKVWYDNSSVWRRGKEALTEYTPNNLHRSTALSELREVAGEMAAGYPEMQGALWLCVCGRPNHVSVAQCARCGRDKRDVFASYSREAVEAVIAARDKATEDKNRAAVSETSRLQAQREKETMRRRRRRRVIAGVLALLVLLAGGGYLTMFHVLPRMKYEEAENALAQGQYELAYQTFAELGDYEDAAQRAQESQYRQAASLITGTDLSGKITLEDIAQARRLIESLGDYEGAAELLKECDYQEAQIRLSNGEWDAAAVMFETLGDYRDSAEMCREVAYRRVCEQMETTEDYESIREAFQALGDYRDSATMIEKTWYLEAEDALEREDPVSALNCLAEIPDYEGAAELAQRAHYEYGLQLKAKGETTTAAEQFYEAKGYQDANDQANESYYEPAVKALESGKYREAIRLLSNIRGYRDAEELWQKAVYEQAQVEIKALDFEEAQKLLAELPEDYEQVADLKKDCIYLPAQIAYSRGEYEKAIEGFEAVSTYGQSESMILTCKYEWAAKKAADGDLEGALALYTELGDYKDSQKKHQEIRSTQAATLAGNGTMEDLQKAEEIYSELNDTDSVNATRYAQAEKLLDEGQYESAKQMFVALGSYQDAQTKATDCDLALAAQYRADGRLEDAAALLETLEGSDKATALLKEVRYEQGEKAAADSLPLDAAAYFKAAGDYQDAAEKAQEQSILYYDPIAQMARNQFNQQEYVACADLLMPLDMANLPEGYSDLPDILAESCYQAGESYFAQGQPYAALPYYQQVADERRVKERLKESCYLILGNWTDTNGNAYVFQSDGTCTLNGEKLYFAVDGLTIRTGTSDNVLTDTHRLTGITTKTAWLYDQRSGTDVLIYLTKAE